MQQEEWSDFGYEELGDVVYQLLGAPFYETFQRLQSYKDRYRMLKGQHKDSMRLVHHWKDKCLATAKELGELKAKHDKVGNELLELKLEHEQLGSRLSQGTADDAEIQRLKSKGLKRQSLMSQEGTFLMSQRLRMQNECYDEPQFKKSKTNPPAQVLPIGATMPKVLKPMFDEPKHGGNL